VPATPTGTTPGSTTSPGPTTSGTTVGLGWNAVTGATYYSFGVTDIAAGVLVVDKTTSGTSYSASLSAGKNYRWNVAACNASGCSGYTTLLYFQTPSAATAPAMPTGTTPGSTTSPGPTTSGTTVGLGWNAVTGATYYSFGVTDIAAGVLVVDTTTTGTSYSASLSAGKKYRWNVAACNASGCSGYTPLLYFQTPSVVASQPAKLTAPSPGSAFSGTSATFKWSTGTGVTDYWLYVGSSAGGNDFCSQDQGTNLSVTVSGLPTDGRVLYVTLWSWIGGAWQNTNATYTAYTASSQSGTELSPGSTIANRAIALGEQHRYRFPMVLGRTYFVVAIPGAHPATDVDLYTSNNSNLSTTAYQCAPRETGTTPEVCKFVASFTGTYWLLVNGTTAGRYMLSVFEQYSGQPVPTASVFDSPVAPPAATETDTDADGWYSAQDFGECNTSTIPPKLHLGEDWNRSGPDRGEVVRAVADGVVTYVAQPLASDGTPSDSWKGVLVVRHAAPTATPFLVPAGSRATSTCTSAKNWSQSKVSTAWSFYGHLDKCWTNTPLTGCPSAGSLRSWLRVGDVVRRGQPI